MELTYLQRLKLLNEINNIIQVQEIQFKNAEPFYHVAAELQNFLELLPDNGCLNDFDKCIERDCRKYLKEMIEESKKEVPEKLSKDPKKTIYLEHTMKQLKETSFKCLRNFKNAYEIFCPTEMIE